MRAIVGYPGSRNPSAGVSLRKFALEGGRQSTPSGARRDLSKTGPFRTGGPQNHIGSIGNPEVEGPYGAVPNLSLQGESRNLKKPSKRIRRKSDNKVPRTPVKSLISSRVEAGKARRNGQADNVKGSRRTEDTSKPGRV